jgi:hypothetical protein
LDIPWPTAKCFSPVPVSIAISKTNKKKSGHEEKLLPIPVHRVLVRHDQVLRPPRWIATGLHKQLPRKLSSASPHPNPTGPPPPRVKTSELRSDRQLRTPATAAPGRGTTTEGVMDSVVRPHFSGLRLDSRRPSSSSLPNSPSPASGNGAADANGFASPTKADGTRQPFVIGTRLAATGPAAWLPRLEFSACPDPRFF